MPCVHRVIISMNIWQLLVMQTYQLLNVSIPLVEILAFPTRRCMWQFMILMVNDPEAREGFCLLASIIFRDLILYFFFSYRSIRPLWQDSWTLSQKWHRTVPVCCISPSQLVQSSPLFARSSFTTRETAYREIIFGLEYFYIQIGV